MHDLPVSKWRWRSAMLVFMLVYVLNFLDRQVINILAERIKQDLALADWQLGMLTGFAFALFYALAGIPIARYAERANRRNIVAVAVALWSGFTVLSGLAGSYVQLLLCRFGVGVGEAGGVPPSHSLITEITPSAKLASALALFHIGLPVGTLCGLALGGLMADQFGWRLAFVLAGAPGLVVAIMVYLVIPEPRKARAAKRASPHGDGPGLRETFRCLVRKQTFVYSVLAATAISFTTYAQQAFVPSYFFRLHGADLTRLGQDFGLQAGGYLGISLGLATGLAGAAGLWLGGSLADARSARDMRGYGTVPAIAVALFVPVQALAFFVPTAEQALLVLSLAILLNVMWIAPFQATIQSIAPSRMRATASALGLLAINLVGLGLGPVLLGLLSDVLASQSGLGPDEGLRWALALFSLVGVIAALLFWKAASSIEADVAR